MLPAKPRLIVTRPQPQAARFARALRRRFPGRARVMLSPVMEIVARPPPAALHAAPALILTSENAVRAGGDALPAGAAAHCVGSRTAAAARRAGLRVETRAETAEALIMRLLAAPPAGPLLWLRGEHGRVAIAERLRKAGREADEAVIYDQRARPLTPAARAVLNGTAPVILPLFSPRTARLVAAEAAQARAPLALAALSGAVTAAWTAPPPYLLRQASRPDHAGMMAALDALLPEIGAPE